MSGLMERAGRVDTANEFIRIISSHGRRFFHHDGRISRFELDDRGRVWFIDKYSGSGRRIYTHQNGGWGRWFTEGGTLLDLCKALREFIMRRDRLPAHHLGPWEEWGRNGDLWGYGANNMEKVRAGVADLIKTKGLPG